MNLVGKIQEYKREPHLEAKTLQKEKNYSKVFMIERIWQDAKIKNTNQKQKKSEKIECKRSEKSS